MFGMFFPSTLKAIPRTASLFKRFIVLRRIWVKFFGGKVKSLQ